MTLHADVIRPDELSAAERVLWSEFAAAGPHCDSPFMSLRYVLTAGAIAPEAKIAVVRQGGETVGFLPFQRRGGMLQPLGAPLTDYHGLITRPGVTVELAHVVKAARGQSYRFSGLLGGAPARARC